MEGIKYVSLIEISPIVVRYKELSDNGYCK